MNFKHADNYVTAKAIIAFLVLLIPVMILVLFNLNQDYIVQYNFGLFMVLVTIEAGLLMALLFLVSQSKPKARARRSSKRRRR